jgi:hypothetical protein
MPPAATLKSGQIFMISQKKNQLREKKMDKGKWVMCSFGDDTRKVEIEEGAIYIVDPLNKRKKKHRGEKVKLISSDMDGTIVLRIESEWHVKKKSYTKMDICDLRLVDNEESIPQE